MHTIRKRKKIFLAFFAIFMMIQSRKRERGTQQHQLQNVGFQSRNLVVDQKIAQSSYLDCRLNQLE